MGLFSFVLCMAAAVVLFSAQAADARAFADPISASAGSDVLCPIRIQGNPGLMGFKIAFFYDSNVLTAVSVQKGEVTQNGMMDDSISVSTPGSFEVIWSHSANVKADGVLMTLAFKAAPTVPDSTEIKIKVSQPDTFNDAWEDVLLQCEPIQISFTDTDTDDAQQSSDVTPGSVTPDAVLYAVDRVMQEQDVSSIAALPESEQDAFLQSVNKGIREATGNADYFSNMQTMTDAYTQAAKETYLAEVQQQVDGDKILLSVEQALEETGASSIDEVPADEQPAFARTVEEKLAQYMPDAPELAGRVDTETALDTIRELQEQVAQDVDDSTPAPVEDHVVNHTLVIVLCAAGAVILAAVIAAAIYIKKKKSKNEGESQE